MSSSSDLSELSDLSESPEASSELQLQLHLQASITEIQQGQKDTSIKEGDGSPKATDAVDVEETKVENNLSKGEDSTGKRDVSPKDLVERSKHRGTAKYLLENANSPLAQLDILKYLAKSESWDKLTKEEQTELTALLPADMLELDAISGSTRPSASFLLSDPMRDAVALFKENLINGFYVPTYLRRAAIAMEERRQGIFDEFLNSTMSN